MENRAAIPLAEYESLQFRYDNLLEKHHALHELIEEIEIDRDGLRKQVANARRLFGEMSAECGKLLDQIKATQQHI